MSIGHSNSVIAKLGLLLLTLILMVSCGTAEPTATPLPATATRITLEPTHTPLPPTATLAPPTATSAPPTATTVPPTDTAILPTRTNTPDTTLSESLYEDEIAQAEAILDACDRPDLPGGYAVAIIKDGKVVFKKAYGWANCEYDIPFTSSTVFDFASVAKQFTGYAIASLVSQGKISLDDDIRQYIPELPDFGETITVKHLLYHTSGIRDWVALVKLSGRNGTDVITDEFLMNIVMHQRELNFKPGERFLYSNTGYFLLAQIVSRVTGQSFREWTDENIFEPLGMQDTLFLDDYSEIIEGRASSYKHGPNGTFANYPSNLTAYGCSSLLSTVDDMAKWVMNYEERRIGGEDLWDMMLEKGVLNDGQKIDYGFGLSLGSYHGVRTYGHGGGWGGYVCQITHFPSQRFALIFVSNRNPSGIYVEQDIYDTFLARKPSGQVPTIVSRTEVAVEPAILEEYVGMYGQDSFIIRVERLDNSLVIHQPMDPNIRVYPESTTKFFLKDGVVQYSFQRDGEGQVNQLTIHTSQGGEFQFDKLDPKVSGYDNVEGLLGEYYSDELETTYRIGIREDQLVVTHFQNEEVFLVRVDQDHYFGDVWWFSEVEFIGNKDNDVIGFRLNADQDSVQNLLFVKR
jgi:CubicO group peptidase (beta-lactamase class C family)